MNVLIVEDNKDSRNLLVKQLSAYGHEVTAAVDGVDALEKALKTPPDILVSDILMPRMDGYKLCYEWKQNKRLKDIPFVFYTAIYTSGEDEKFALSLGANLFIRKPLEPEALARILSQALEQAREGLLPAAEAPPKPSLYLTEYNKRLVAKLNEKVAELEKSEEELRYLSSVLGAIRNINQLIVRERDKAKLLDGACRILLKVREYRFVWFGLIEEGHKRVILVASAGVEDSYLDSVKITWDDRPSGQGPTGTAIKTREPDVIRNILENPRVASWREEALKRGYRSSAAIPLISGDRVYGALSVYSSQRDGFDDTEIGLLMEVSGDLGFALKAIEEGEAHQRAEEELQKSEAFRSGLLANSPTPIDVINPDSSIRYVNPALEKLTGFSAEELIGQKAPFPYWPKERHQEVMKDLKKAMLRGSDRLEELYQKKSGDRFWVEITSTPVKKDSEFQYLLSSWVDITERKQAEEKLRESEARYRAVIEDAHDMIQSVSLDGSIIFVNKSWRDTLGYTEAELSSLNLFNIIHPDSLAHCQEMFAKVVSGKPVHGVEAAFLTKDGRKILVEGNAAPRYIGNKVVATQGIFRDVTESKLKEMDYQNILHTTTDGFWIVDNTGRFLDVNNAYCALIGYSREELLNMSIRDIEAVEKPEDTARRIRRIIKTGHDRFETRHRCKDGKVVDIEVSTTYAGADDGRLFAFLRDITARKEAEDALRESEAFQSGLLSNSPIPISVINADSSVRYVNPALLKLTGFSAEELTNEKAPYSYWPEEEADKIMKGFRKAMRYGSDRVVEPFKKKNGERFWVEITTIPVKKDGKFLYLLASWVDITERKLAVEKLRDEATRRRILVDQSRDGIVVLDEKGKVYEANRRFAEMLGYSPEEVRKLHVWDWEFLYEREKVAEMLASVGPEGDHFETKHRRKDSTVFDVEISTNGAVYAGQKLIFCVCRDITARKQAEAALKESEEKYKTLVETTSDIIWEVDAEGRFTFISPKVKDLLGYEVDEVVGKKRTLDLIAKGQSQRWLKRFKELNAKREPFFDLEITHVHKDGRQVIIETSGIPLFDSAGKFKGYVGINKDITERRNMQEQLVIADRLASVGELAAGIAHELNNPLTGVVGFSQLLMEKEMPEDIKQDVQMVYREAQRASQVVKNLLTFARKHAATKERVNINDVINKVLELRAYEQNLENIKVKAHYDSALPEVMADYFQLQQVFLNIVINAEYFMKEANHKGNLTITTEKVGNKIRASFADDGPGITKENLGHIFDPFFTTKEVGRGTGLGLSICHGIIAEHGGGIYVESELGKGATFIVELPIGAAEGKKGGAL
jgi:PAS domain S-box-containing protein